jgi:hypothetical protein
MEVSLSLGPGFGPVVMAAVRIIRQATDGAEFNASFASTPDGVGAISQGN